ncbi:MAG: 50S ribosomal protein L32 [Candidatus Sumerlaeia bacterium]|nr:50S ribosomal protein L32 [Candidatus Sumerlaeia bacterium]
MPVPRRRHGRSRQGKDRAHKKLYAKFTVSCDNCGAAKLAHRICPFCGHYKKVLVRKTGAPTT